MPASVDEGKLLLSLSLLQRSSPPLCSVLPRMAAVQYRAMFLCENKAETDVSIVFFSCRQLTFLPLMGLYHLGGEPPFFKVGFPC